MKSRNTAFLLKKAKTAFTWSPEDIDDAIMVVLGYGDPTVAELAAAMFRHTTVPPDPESHDDYRETQQEVRRVIDWVVAPGGSDSNALGGAVTMQIDWDLPSKGIPFARGDGPQLYLFNMRSTTATSSTATAVSAITKWWGADLS